LKFDNDEDSEPDLLEVATRHVFLRGLIDTCHDLWWVRKWPPE